METSRPGGGGFDAMKEYSKENRNDFFTEKITQELDIQRIRQDRDYDCAPTACKMIANFLGIPIEEKTYLNILEQIKPQGGTSPNAYKSLFSRLGLKGIPYKYSNKEYFKDGISDVYERDAVYFIINSMKNNNPVFIGFWAKDMPSNLGHAGVIQKIVVNETVNRKGKVNINFIITINDPSKGSRTINTFNQHYEHNEIVKSLFSMSKL